MQKILNEIVSLRVLEIIISTENYRNANVLH